MINTRITFIGCGNMGRSLIGGLIADGHKPDAITGVEPDEAKAAFIKKEYGVEVVADGSHAIKGSDVIILAVKPQVIVACLQNLAEQIRKYSPLIISVAAGVRIDTLENVLGEETAIVRTMPNTPALIGAGAFLANYQLASINDIMVHKELHGGKASYVHKKYVLRG